jgi:enoyl-CoA hydratase
MLAAMCDLIVAADDAVFQNPVLRMSGAGVELLVEPWEIGIRKAKEFLLTGDEIDAHEAWRLGMVNKVVPRGELAGATRELAERSPSSRRSPPRWSSARSTRPSSSWASETRGTTTSWPTTSPTTPPPRCGWPRSVSRAGSMKRILAARDRGDAMSAS